MNALAIIQLVLMLLNGVLSAAKQANLTNIVTAAEAAISALEQVHGTTVTAGQLEGLTVKPQW